VVSRHVFHRMREQQTMLTPNRTTTKQELGVGIVYHTMEFTA